MRDRSRPSSRVSPRILVVGLGNVLMRDDAIGPYCVQHLRTHYELPPDVTVVDLGTAGPELAVQVESADIIIVVDALRGVEPGSLHVFDRASLWKCNRGDRLHAQARALEEAIELVEDIRGTPLDIVVVGLGGLNFDRGTTLSPVVQDRIAALADRVLDELARRDAAWCRRAFYTVAQAWREQPAASFHWRN